MVMTLLKTEYLCLILHKPVIGLICDRSGATTHIASAELKYIGIVGPNDWTSVIDKTRSREKGTAISESALCLER